MQAPNVGIIAFIAVQHRLRRALASGLMIRVSISPALSLLLSTVALLAPVMSAQAASCDDHFESSGTTDAGLTFASWDQLPGVPIDSALAQMRAIASKDGFLIGALTNDQNLGKLVIEQAGTSKARSFQIIFAANREGRVSMSTTLPPGMGARAADMRPALCGMLARLQSGAAGQALAAQGREVPQTAKGPNTGDDYQPGPPIVDTLNGEWWVVFGYNDKPERVILWADSQSVKPGRAADGSAVVDVTAARLFESGKSPIDNAVYAFQLRCSSSEVRTASITITLRDTSTYVKKTPVEWQPTKNSPLDRVRLFACEPKAREKNMMLKVGQSTLANIFKATWGAFWQDGVQPKVAVKTPDQNNEARAAAAADLANSF
ncbi:hypothetical protein BH09PSE6_BH09PSE6_17630 [soil metagenome]